MHPSGDLRSTPEFDYEGWRNALRPDWGWYNPKASKSETFAGRARLRRVYGLVAMDLSCNAQRVDRTQRDAGLDGVDHYYAVFQTAGESTVIQNDQAVKLAMGDAALVDSARPITYASEGRYGHFALQLPRRSLVSHLGFHPEGGILRRGGTSAGRVLFHLIQDAGQSDGSGFSPVDSYLQLAVYDLVGALFASSDPSPLSHHTDKLFARIRGIVKDGFDDPDFGPCQVAAEAGISLRYVQKLFTQRGSTCSEFIYALRLDHAAGLLKRRALLRTNQPLSEIAYVCGFHDYAHFARKFRHRFGHAPGDHSRDRN
jgi:AraC family transcriptional regulator, positive regulator of tynA and feaB